MVSVSQLEDLCSPVVEGMGLQLWGIEYFASGAGGRLRVYIDSASGVDVEDCAAVSRQLSALLDVEDPIVGDYNLEVSSPGLDRPLFKAAHFEQFLGCQVRLLLLVPVSGRKKINGVLKQIQDKRLFVQQDDDEEILMIPVHQVRRANLVYSSV